MHARLILHWSYIMGRIARVLIIVVLCLDTWTKRQNFIELYKSYRKFENKYPHFHQKYTMPNKMQNEIEEVKYYTTYKLCTMHGNALLVSRLLLQIQGQPSPAYILMVSTNFLQSFYLLSINLQFFLILSRMHLHFTFINKSLEDLTMESYYPLSHVIMRFWTLYRMHYDCYHLSRRILYSARTSTMIILVKTVTMNIIILYHAVQFVNGSIDCSGTDNIVDILSIVGFYWDAVLTMIAIDKLLTSSNNTSKILGEFLDYSDKEKKSYDKWIFTKMV